MLLLQDTTKKPSAKESNLDYSFRNDEVPMYSTDSSLLMNNHCSFKHE